MNDLDRMEKHALQASDERLDATKRSGVDAVADARAVYVATDETCILEDLQVLRDSRLGERQLVHDIAAYAHILADQNAEDLHAGGVSNRFGEPRELIIGFGALDRAEVHVIRVWRAAALWHGPAHR